MNNNLNIQQIKERQEFENYNKVKLLGEGSFGKAYLVKRQTDGLMCVMKQIDIGKLSDAEKKEVLQEAKLLEVLSHPNIVKFIEVYKTKKGKLCIIMDYADGGDLGQKVKEQRGKSFSEAQILDWFVQLCLGMKHIHDRKIIHRDLKGGNVFLTSKGIVQIGDFGIAKVLAATMAKAKTCVGTPYYLSPEVVQSQPYSLSTDVWSMGVMLYELCALKPPFDAPSLHLLSMKIVRGVYSPLSPNFSQGLRNLVTNCLNIVPQRRPTVNEILKLPIIQNRIKTYLSASIIQSEFSHTVLHKQNVFDQKVPQQNQNQVQSYMPQPLIHRDNSQNNAPYALPGQRPITPSNLPVTPNKDLQQRQANAQQYVNLVKPSAISPGMAAALGQYGLNVQKDIPGAGQGAQKKQNYHYVSPQAQQQAQFPPAQKQNNIPLSYLQAAQIAKEGGVSPKPDHKQQDEKERLQKIDDLEKKIKEKQAEYQRLDQQKIEKDKVNAEKEAQYRRQIREAEEQRRIQELEIKAKAADNKKLDEQKKLKELEDARKQAYKDRLEMQARVQARLNEKDPKLEAQEREQAERRRQLEDVSRQRQEEAIKQKQIREQQMREEDILRKQKFDQEREKWKQQQNKEKKEQERLKQEERARAQAEIEQIRQQKLKKQAEDQKRKEEQQLQAFLNVQKKAPSQPNNLLPAKDLNTIQKITRDVQNNISNIVAGIEKKVAPPKQQIPDQDDAPIKAQVVEISAAEKLKIQRDLERQKMRKEILQKKSNWGDVKVDIVGVNPQDLKDDTLRPPLKQDNKRKNVQPAPQQYLAEADKVGKTLPVEDERDDIDSDEFADDKSDDIKRSNNQNVYDEIDEESKIIEEEIQLQKQRGQWQLQQNNEIETSDPRYQFYQEMLAIARDGQSETITAISDLDEAEYQAKIDREIQQAMYEFAEIDREDEDSPDEIEVKPVQKRLDEFTFVGGAGENPMLVDYESRMYSIEHTREFLEQELGERTLMKIYPVLLDFGDDIHLEENFEQLVRDLKPIIPRETVQKYVNFFKMIVFFEKEADESGGGDKGEMNASLTMKNLTAMTGRFGGK